MVAPEKLANVVTPENGIEILILKLFDIDKDYTVNPIFCAVGLR